MVHADASNFATGITKDEAYQQVFEHAEALFDGQRNWVCNLANVSSLLWHAYQSLPAPSSRVNWAGFYVVDPLSPRDGLVLGPFHGKPACQAIAFGRGVCGAAAARRATQLVDDVHAFPGHIACDGDSRSEIVVPILVAAGEQEEGKEKEEGKKEGGRLVGIVDIDCTELSGFDDTDRLWLERLAALIARSCDWP